MINLIIYKLAIYEYALSNFYLKISNRKDEYSNLFYLQSRDEFKHCIALLHLLNFDVYNIQFLNDLLIIDNQKLKTNYQLSTRDIIFRILFLNKPASEYPTKVLLNYVSVGESIAVITYSLLLIYSIFTFNKLQFNIFKWIIKDELNHTLRRR